MSCGGEQGSFMVVGILEMAKVVDKRKVQVLYLDRLPHVFSLMWLLSSLAI